MARTYSLAKAQRSNFYKYNSGGKMDRGFAGVRPRGNSILMDFTYKGERCRETLRVKPTKSALKAANQKREAILYEIAMGSFDYAQHFPESTRALKYAKVPGCLVSIEGALKSWLSRAQKRCQYSTLRDYSSIVYHHLIPNFGHLKMTELTAEHIDDWLCCLDISNKRINNILSPLKQAFRDAYCSGTIERNPLDRVQRLPVEQREPNPFTKAEIALILQKLTGQEKNLIHFAFWSGLRTSELIGLRWEDVDFERNRIYVRVAVVRSREKSTKTVSGQRTVDLNEESLCALKSQLEFTAEKGRVFHDPRAGKPWLNDQAIRKRLWTPTLKSLGIEYRNPYQTRHTYASMMLSKGENPMWVAQQMGHKDWGMIRKVYGRWVV